MLFRLRQSYPAKYTCYTVIPDKDRSQLLPQVHAFSIFFIFEEFAYFMSTFCFLVELSH